MLFVPSFGDLPLFCTVTAFKFCLKEFANTSENMEYLRKDDLFLKFWINLTDVSFKNELTTIKTEFNTSPRNIKEITLGHF